MDDGLQYSRGTVKEDAKYRPFVLRRLTDMEPQEKKESIVGLVTAKQLKEDIFANVEMLLNSRCHTVTGGFKDFSEVEDSVLGFGIKDFCGKTGLDSYKEELRQHLLRQLRLFEPRLDSSSIRVEASEKETGFLLEYEISGIIRLKEVDEEVKFFSHLDLESGSAVLYVADE
jgi:type VI secretion system lysozyme-like protein